MSQGSAVGPLSDTQLRATPVPTTNDVMRRLAETAQLADIAAQMQSMIHTEWESSHRMGFEIR